jgi:hypothetical protein
MNIKEKVCIEARIQAITKKIQEGEAKQERIIASLGPARLKLRRLRGILERCTQQ